MKRGLVIGLVLACGLAQARPLSPEPMPEYAMKAAYLYNFALFTEWPTTPGEQLNLCLLGRDAFGTAIDSIDGKPVNGMRIEVSRVTAAGNISHCQMLFLGELDGVNPQRLLRDIEGLPMLTVTDDSALDGVMIRMSIRNKRLTFEINSEAVRRARLTLSSKLLRLASNVY